MLGGKTGLLPTKSFRYPAHYAYTLRPQHAKARNGTHALVLGNKTKDFASEFPNGASVRNPGVVQTPLPVVAPTLQAEVISQRGK